ncbi:MAG: hypothetical protein HY445_00905 [Candidatus Niyogibacteria bacterium]|nr:hypothetical protein [Candidatus Niyogibacteria bacterium]
MPNAPTLLIIGDSQNIKRFAPHFQSEGFKLLVVEKISEALFAAQQNRLHGIVFIVPVYWQPITHFVEEVRKLKGYAHFEVPIFYLGKLIEGEDQKILQKHGVKVLTLGPVPDSEIARYVSTQIQY